MIWMEVTLSSRSSSRTGARSDSLVMDRCPRAGTDSFHLVCPISRTRKNGHALLEERGLAAEVWSLCPCNHVEEEPRIPRPDRIPGKIRSIHPYSGEVVDP